MPSLAKNKPGKIPHSKTIGIVDPKVKSYANDPVFLQRAKEAREWLQKVGLPEELKGKYKI